jgi:hypothetical protein
VTGRASPAWLSRRSLLSVFSASAMIESDLVFGIGDVKRADFAQS